MLLIEKDESDLSLHTHEEDHAYKEDDLNLCAHEEDDLNLHTYEEDDS